jgi:ParB-like chromosome segregation protein Spo0J
MRTNTTKKTARGKIGNGKPSEIQAEQNGDAVAAQKLPAAPAGQLRVESIPIASVSVDPANARKHGPKNLDAIKASLRRFGQQKPIIIDGSNVVRAGNGTLEAAKALGWKEIQIVRSGLHVAELAAFAIADNRTGELAEWDSEMLTAELAGLKEGGFDLGELGFDEKDMKKLLGEEEGKESAGQTLGDEKWLVVVTLENEAAQLAFLAEMQSAGRECRALVG